MTEKLIKIKNSKGDDLSLIIDYSANTTERIAILCPGYLDTKDYQHLKNLAHELNDIGYTTVRFDPTGTWESGGDISEYTVTQYLADLKSVWEYISKDNIYTEVLLTGHSLGGMMSILFAARNSFVTEVLAIMSAVNLPSALADSKRIKWKNEGIRSSLRDVPIGEGDRVFKVPYSYVEDMMKYSVIEDVKLVHQPIVFLAGELDVLIPPKNIEKIFDQANEPKKFIIVEGIGHTYRRNTAEIDKVNKVGLKALLNLKERRK